DASASMSFPDGPASKLRYAVVAASALAHLISGQGDAVGLVADRTFLPPRAGRQHLRGLLAALAALKVEREWAPGDVIRRAAERLGRRGLLLGFSDLYDAEEETFAALRRAPRLRPSDPLVREVRRSHSQRPHP